MKKFLCILLVTALLFAFAACGGSDTSVMYITRYSTFIRLRCMRRIRHLR